MTRTMRCLLRVGVSCLAAVLITLPGTADARTSDVPVCADPLKCSTFEKPVAPQNVYKQMVYERTIDGDTFVASGKTIRV
jgi:hypothetical protein